MCSSNKMFDFSPLSSMYIKDEETNSKGIGESTGQINGRENLVDSRLQITTYKGKFGCTFLQSYIQKGMLETVPV